MNRTTLIYETLEEILNAEPHKHAQIRQNLYNQLDLSFEKQLVLYSNFLGPTSAGRITDIKKAAIAANKALS